ncbi:MAG: hypothetical protein WBG37_09775 [Desulfobacterales bacterium]
MVAAAWRIPLGGLISEVGALLDRTLSGREANSVTVYFRADDIAVPSAALARLMGLFLTHRTPLALALVPAWLSAPRWKTLRQWGEAAPGLWCWHQHGWRHHNHNHQGKKAEFGAQRLHALAIRDLTNGLERLHRVVGAAFTPILTPPWNRLNPELLFRLEAMGFSAISRDESQARQYPAPLPEIPVHLDLHTHKASHPPLARHYLLDALGSGLESGCCGIMIHHQRMNDNAFDFLDFLLDTLGRSKAVAQAGFNDLLSRPPQPPARHMP